MGHSNSQLKDSIVGQRRREIDFLRRELGLTEEEGGEEIEKVLHVFREANLHDDGCLAFDEFCMQVKHEPTVFSETVFAFFSSSPSRSSRLTVGLNFAEFLLFSFFYLTMDDDGLIEYLYTILTDKEYNPMIQDSTDDPTDVKNMERNIEHMFGHAWAANDHKLVAVGHAFDYLGSANKHDHHITHAKFHEGCKKNTSLIHPAMALQIDMWGRIVNKSLWKHHRGLGNKLVAKIVTVRDTLHSLMGVQQYHEQFHQLKKHKAGFHTEIRTLPTAPPHKEWQVGATGKMHRKYVHAPAQTVEVEVPDSVSVFTKMHKQDMHGRDLVTTRHDTEVGPGFHHKEATHHPPVADVAEEHHAYFPHHYTDVEAARLDPLRLPQHGVHSVKHDKYDDPHHHADMSVAALRARSMHNLGRADYEESHSSHSSHAPHHGGAHSSSFSAHHVESKMEDHSHSHGHHSQSFSVGGSSSSHHTAGYEHAAAVAAKSASRDQYLHERQRMLGLDADDDLDDDDLKLV